MIAALPRAIQHPFILIYVIGHLLAPALSAYQLSGDSHLFTCPTFQWLSAHTRLLSVHIAAAK